MLLCRPGSSSTLTPSNIQNPMLFFFLYTSPCFPCHRRRRRRHRRRRRRSVLFMLLESWIDSKLSHTMRGDSCSSRAVLLLLPDNRYKSPPRPGGINVNEKSYVMHFCVALLCAFRHWLRERGWLAAIVCDFMGDITIWLPVAHWLCEQQQQYSPTWDMRFDA